MGNDELYSIDQIIQANGLLESEAEGVEKLLNNIVIKIFQNDINEGNIDSFRSYVRKIEVGYSLMKEIFSKKYRTSGERYFEHLRGVAEIVLELPNPTIDKILLALYHDAIEDTDATFENIEFTTRDYKIAIGVEAISKKDWKLYSEDEKKGKELRNTDYFSHLESFEKMSQHVIEIAEDKGYTLTNIEVKEITQNIFDVKFADRIHNLSTQWDKNDTNKVRRKIDETKKYFLPIAKTINPIAYNLMKSHILKLEIQLNSHNKKIKSIINDE